MYNIENKIKGVNKMDLLKAIKTLKQQKNAVILAHYYVPENVQKVADYIGDSFYLSKIAKNTNADIIVFAGVLFMGESAKILNPDKKVLLPDMSADCPMAHMCNANTIEAMRNKYEDLSVVCYINSTADLKAISDVCVTSSNAVRIVKNISSKNIFFVPDKNLGSYVAKQVPEKNIICNDGYCPIHKQIEAESVQQAKQNHAKALFLAHPECTEEVLSLADFVGSTSEIINFATENPAQEFIIGTEMGVLYELMKNNPQKIFYPVSSTQYCADMKKITLDKIFDTLMNEKHEVHIDEKLALLAKKSLDKMLELGK